MPLTAGTRLGPYEVVGALGAGGMGEVYRARDTRLGRTVALKVLPPDFTTDPHSRRRFEQEARAVSALNHPHICALYDVGSEGGTDFLVMEYLQGETLAARLAKGPLPIGEALDYAVHIADALGRAHRSGIVHRDVKPGNVMLTKDGAKLLDFGLARGRALATAALAATVTHAFPADPLTKEGLVVGTVPYMSPEQLEGRETDPRADIFSFGAVLYEMLAGRRRFDGESQASVIAQIMAVDSRPTVELQPITPVSLDRVIRQCLAKDPDKRWQSVSDVARQLEGIAEELRAPRSGAQPVIPPVTRWWRARYAQQSFAAAALLVIAGALAGAFAIGERTATPSQPTFHRITYRRGTVMGAQFTKDARNVVYTARWDGNSNQVFTVRADGVDSEERTALQGLNVASMSQRDEVAGLRGGTLSTAPFSGGAPRDLARGVTSADWSPDGSRLAVTRDRAVEYPLGKVIYRARDPGRGTVSDVRVSPGGDLLAFREHESSHGSIVIIDAAGNKKAQSSYVDGIEPPVWHPGGREVWFSAMQPDARDAVRALDLRGRERSILRNPAMIIRDISRDGRVLLTSDYAVYSIYGRGPGDAAEHDLTYYGSSLLDDLSADGRTLLFTEGGESNPKNEWNLYMRGIDASAPQRIGGLVYGKISPDKQWVAALDPSRDGTALTLIPTGPGEQRQLERIDTVPLEVVGWLPDSSAVIYNRADRIWIVPLKGSPRALSPEGWFAPQGLVSPDGHFLCETSVPGEPSIYLCSVNTPVSTALPQISDANKWIPLGWTQDGRKLWVTTRPNAPTRRVFILDPATGVATPWKELGAQVDRAGLLVTPRIRISPDGESYAYTFVRRLSTLYVVANLR